MNETMGRTPPAEAMRRGLSGYCPRCGRGRLFSEYLTLAPQCRSCGLDYSFADSGDGPAVFVVLLMGFLLVGLALWVELAFAPPLWLHFLVWVPVAIAGCLLPLRLVKGVLFNLQYAHDAAEERAERDKP
jgi:uncharacterized protein (DUF983 family)